MIAWIKKGLFLTPFILFFFAANRYTDDNGTDKHINEDIESTSTIDKTIVVEPGERLKIIVEHNTIELERDLKYPLVLLKSGANDSTAGENNTKNSSQSSFPGLAEQMLVCHQSVEDGKFVYVCTIPDNKTPENEEAISLIQEK